LAQRFGLAVLAVVDASAMAGTFGALAWGLQHYRPGLRWAGVLANRVASERHADMLQASVQGTDGEPAPWRGALFRNADFSLPERHLGLTVATEVSDALARLDAAADALAQTPLGQMSLQELQRWTWSGDSAVVDAPAAAPSSLPSPPPSPLAGVTVAVARDAAFCFVYEANLACLRRLGAQVVLFSPLADAHLPACDAVWLPGGYPELHAPALSRQHMLRGELAQHVAQGKPVWAECGGMMLLFDQLITADGQSHTMWGLLPGTVRMQKRLAGLGPQQLSLGSDVMRGHTFHYSVCDTPVPEVARSARPHTAVAPGQGEALYQWGSIRASYFHAWFDASPTAVARLFTPEAPVPQALS
jgi:cobyrinic acid a,c-diamide synthase